MSIVIVNDGEISYHNPLGEEKSRELESLLSEAGCFVPSFVAENPYSLDTYIRAFALWRTETTFLLDRNIYSQVLSLAKGGIATKDTEIAAAVMAFASCANIDIEPSLAIYEGTASGVRGGWRRDLALFHAADKIAPVNWAALALGVFERFTGKIVRRPLSNEIDSQFDPSMRLKSFWFVYPTLLKMANIRRGRGSCDSKMLILIEWIYRWWHFSAPTIFLASQVLGPNPPKKAFKAIGSSDRHLALRGVKNAAWDLVYITEWFKGIMTQADDNKLTVICTRDALLSKVATLLQEALFNKSEVDILRDQGCGESVISAYVQCGLNLKDSKRALIPMPLDFPKYRKRLIDELETEFLM